MDKIEILKLKGETIVKNIKEHVLFEIFEKYSDIELVKFKKYQIKKIILDYIESKQYKKPKYPRSVDYYLVRGWTLEEAKEIVNKLQSKSTKALHVKRKENPENYKEILSPYTVEFWIKKGYDIETANIKIKENRPTNINYWLAKGYNEVEANHKLSMFQKEAGDEFIKKINEDPTKYNNIRQNQIQYWLDRGFSDDEANKKIKEWQTTFTLEKCIKRYGEEKGTRVFNDRQEKWIKSLYANFKKYGDGRSPQSKWVNDIKAKLKEIGFDIPDKEKWIKDGKTNRSYSFDLTIGKKMIEFNGDYWHMNPVKYKEDDFNKTIKLLATEKWQYDAEKIKTAESNGYDVLIVWESEYNENPSTIIEKCIKHLK
jgi:hypothetical protein